MTTPDTPEPATPQNEPEDLALDGLLSELARAPHPGDDERFVARVRERIAEEGREQAAPAAAPETAHQEGSEHARPSSRKSVRPGSGRRRRARLERRRSPNYWARAALAASVAVAATVCFVVLRERSGLPSQPEVLGEIVQLHTLVEKDAPPVVLREGKAEPAETNAKIRAGDRVETRGGGVRLHYLNEATVLDLKSDTVARLGLSAGAKTVRLDRGELSATVAKQPEDRPLRFVTPHADAVVVGTRLGLRVKDDGTRLDVLEGLVGLERSESGERLDVAAGRSAVAPAHGRLALVDGLPPAKSAETAVPARTPVRYFSDSSPWNLAAPANPVLDPDSAAMVDHLAEKSTCNLYRFAVPVYEADAQTPVRKVTCTKYGTRSPFEPGMEIRVPTGAQPNVGNGWLLVIDRQSRRTWEFWYFTWSGQDIRSAWGGTVGLDGKGEDSAHAGAAGGSLLPGLIRVRDIEAGRIPHALAFATCYARNGVVRYPARYPEGELTGPDSIPNGTRIQLDPTLDLSAIPGLTRGELTIGRALQEYGGYCLGKTNDPLAFFFEAAPDATDADHPGAVYSANGLTKDAATLPHIPWRALRVLRQWDGR
jgi:ferric-dicitrate binding protein FerR (iron transport regulator)